MFEDIVNGQRIVAQDGHDYVKVDLFGRPVRGGGYLDRFRWWKPRHVWALVQHKRWQRRYW